VRAQVKHSNGKVRHVRHVRHASPAARLSEIADQVRRLGPPDHRDPERWHVDKSEIVAELNRLARQLEAA